MILLACVCVCVRALDGGWMPLATMLTTYQLHPLTKRCGVRVQRCACIYKLSLGCRARLSLHLSISLAPLPFKSHAADD